MNLQVSNPKGLYICSFVFFVVGFILLGTAGILTWTTSRFIDRSQSADGTVTALVAVASTSDDSNRKTTYAPVFSFKASNGKAYSVTSTSSNNPPAFEVNDEVKVLYDASDPMNARIDSTFQLWGAPLILCCVAIVFVLFASASTLALRSLARRQSAAVPPPA